nr:reverse transcriptase domain-containing protein [Tanacetum cinerariifolium]
TMMTCHPPIRPATTCIVPRIQLLAASRRHVAASYWTAVSDVAPTSAPVNAAGHRSTTAVHGGDRRSTPSVNDGQCCRPPVNAGRSRWDTINAPVEGTFIKRRPEECYDLIKNMTAHHNGWDTSAQRSESSRSITSSSPKIAALTQQIEKMKKNFLRMSQSNQQVNVVNLSCETCGGPHHYFECQAASGFTQGDVYDATGNNNVGGGGTRPRDKHGLGAHFKFRNFAEALAHMIKHLLNNKEKLLEWANTSLNENFSAECMAIADLGASINLMPLFVWKKLMLPELLPTRMTLDLANRSAAYPAGITEDVFVQVGYFTFPADFIVVDYDINPRVPLIVGRPFLRTARALVDV